MVSSTRTTRPSAANKRSIRKAAARPPRSASSTVSSTPSGVWMRRKRRLPAGMLALIAIAWPPAAAQEQRQPEDEHADPDQIAQRIVGDELAAQTLQRAGDQKHADRPQYDRAGNAPAR